MSADKDPQQPLREALDYRYREIVEESGIAPYVASERGYRLEKTKAGLSREGFTSRFQQRVPAIVIPRIAPSGEKITPVIKPDNPRKKNSKPGERKLVKYECVSGRAIRLSVHPRVVKVLRDVRRPLWITEGEKKGDALVSHKVAAVVLQGTACWNVPQDWEEIKLYGREVVIAFDADVMTNLNVLRELKKLSGFLRFRGANVKYLNWPEKYLGTKTGVDDALGAGVTIEEIRGWAGDAPEPGDPVPETFTAAGLMVLELPPLQWVVPDLLPEGVTVLGGKPKMGKSWLALGLGIAVASGGVALGTKPVQRGEVLYLALEDNPRRLQKRLGKLLDGGGAPPGLHIATDWPRMDEGGGQILEDWLKEHPEARLVVVDILKKVRPRLGANRNVYEADYEALEAMQRLAGEYGVGILVVHHLRKMGASDPLDELSGSTGLSGGADGILVLKRDRGRADAYLHVTGREIEEEAELALKWDANLASWSLAGDAEDYRVSEERRTILNVLRKSPEPMTPKEVAEALGKTSNTIKQRLWRMSKDGQLVSVEGGYTLVTHNPHNHDNPNPVTGVTEVMPVTAVTGVTDNQGRPHTNGRVDEVPEEIL